MGSCGQEVVVVVGRDKWSLVVVDRYNLVAVTDCPFGDLLVNYAKISIDATVYIYIKCVYL